MKIGLVSEKFINNDVDFNVRQIENALKNNEGCDLLLFGESFLQGFEGLTWKYGTDKNRAIKPNSEAFAKIKAAAKKYRAAVGFGYFQLDGEQIFSSYTIIDDNGELIYNFKRLSIGWKEYSKTDGHYAEGKNFEVGEYKGKKFICALCGDLWYDDNLKQAQNKTCDFVMWPCYTDYPIEDWERMKYEYAQRVSDIIPPVLFINSLADDSLSDDPCYGGCLVFNKGQVKKELKAGNIGILIAEF